MLLGMLRYHIAAEYQVLLMPISLIQTLHICVPETCDAAQHALSIGHAHSLSHDCWDKEAPTCALD